MHVFCICVSICAQPINLMYTPSGHRPVSQTPPQKLPQGKSLPGPNEREGWENRILWLVVALTVKNWPCLLSQERFWHQPRSMKAWSPWEGKGASPTRKGILKQEHRVRPTHSTQEVALEWNHFPSSTEPHDPLLPHQLFLPVTAPLRTGNFRPWLGEKAILAEDGMGTSWVQGWERRPGVEAHVTKVDMKDKEKKWGRMEKAKPYRADALTTHGLKLSSAVWWYLEMGTLGSLCHESGALSSRINALMRMDTSGIISLPCEDTERRQHL